MQVGWKLSTGEVLEPNHWSMAQSSHCDNVERVMLRTISSSLLLTLTVWFRMLSSVFGSSRVYLSFVDGNT